MATSHDRFLCKSFSRYTPRAFREHSLDCCIDGVRGADTWGKTLLNKGFATRAGAPWARLRSASRRRRIAHAGGAILAQDGSWRFFDRGGEGGDGRILRDADRTVGKDLWSLVWTKTCLQALKGGSADYVAMRRDATASVLSYFTASCRILAGTAQIDLEKPVLFCWTDLEISRERRGSRDNR